MISRGARAVLPVWAVLLAAVVIEFHVLPKTLTGLVIFLFAAPVVLVILMFVGEGLMELAGHFGLFRISDRLAARTAGQTVSGLRIFVLLGHFLAMLGVVALLMLALGRVIPPASRDWAQRSDAFVERHFITFGWW